MLENDNFKTQVKGFIKNSCGLMSIRVLSSFCSFVVIVLITRKLGAVTFGTYIIAYNLYFLFCAISLLGLGNFVTREIAKDKSQTNSYIVNIGLIGSLSSLACFILLHLTAYLLNYPLEIKQAAFFISLALFPAIGTQLCESVFIASKKVNYLFFTIFVERLFEILLIFLVLTLGYGVNVLMIAVVISKFMGLAMGLLFIIRQTGWLKFGIDFSFCRKVIQEITPVFALVMIVCSFLFRIDILVLSKLRTTREVGWYGSAYKFIGISQILISAFAQNMFPIISRLFVDQRELFEAVCKKFLKYIGVLILPVMIIVSCLSEQLILLFFGKEFVPSAAALKILIWSILPAGWAGFCGLILYAGNKQKMVLYALSITLSFSLIVNLFLTSYRGYLGTSLATLISMSIWAAVTCFFVYRYMFKFDIVQIAVWPLVSAIPTVIFIYLGRQYVNAVFLIPPGIIVYCLSLFIFKTITKKEVSLFLERKFSFK
jgi:O-antigen/teichoic acid export membrane protein